MVKRLVARNTAGDGKKHAGKEKGKLMVKSGYGDRASPQPTTKRNVDKDSGDFYPTPLWATGILLRHESFEGKTWEPACGDGAMSRVLIAGGLDVRSSDLFNRGFGTPDVDFLSQLPTNQSRHYFAFDCDNIITNPPYHLAEDFVRIGLSLIKKKLALLVRLAFLESAQRYDGIYEKTPPSRTWIFTKRPTFYPKGAKRGGSGTTAYCWMIWDSEHVGPSELCWFPHKRKIDKPLTLEGLGL